MVRAVVSQMVSDFFAEEPTARFAAVLFRGKVYVGTPRHMDAMNVAFAGMTEQQKRRIANRIADGKEKLLFGSAKGDGSEWKWNEEYQNARMTMYGFD